MKNIRNLWVLSLLLCSFATTISMEPIEKPEPIQGASFDAPVSQDPLPPLADIIQKIEVAKTQGILDLVDLMPAPLLRRVSEEISTLMSEPNLNKESLKDRILSGIFAMNMYQVMFQQLVPEASRFLSVLRLLKNNKSSLFKNIFTKESQILVLEKIIAIKNMMAPKCKALTVTEVLISEKKYTTTKLFEVFFSADDRGALARKVTQKIRIFVKSITSPAALSASNLIHIGFLARLGFVPALNLCYEHAIMNLQEGRSEAQESMGKAWLQQAAEAEHPTARYALALLFKEQGNQEMWHRWLYKAALKDHPHAMADIGVVYCNFGKYKESEYWLRRVVESENLDRWLRRVVKRDILDDEYKLKTLKSLADLLVKTGMVDESERRYRALDQVGHLPATKALALLLQGRGEHDKAQMLYERAGAVNDKHAILNHSMCLAQADDDLGAIQVLGKLEGKSDITYLNNLGALHLKMMDLDGAEVCFRKLCQLDEYRGTLQLAYIMELNGKDEEASHLYIKAIDLKITGAKSRYGDFCFNLGNYTEAEHWYREGVEEDPVFSGLAMGLLLMRKEKYEEAKKLFERVANSERQANVHGMRLLGGWEVKLGDKQEGIRLFRKAIKMGDVESLITLAEVLDISDPEREKLYRRAIELGAIDADVYYAHYLYSQSKNEEAEVIATLLQTEEEQEEGPTESLESGFETKPMGQSVQNNNNMESTSSTESKTPTVSESKRYQKLLARYKAAKEKSETPIRSTSNDNPPRTYMDLSVFTHPDALDEIYQGVNILTIVKRLITCLANGEQLASFEKLKGYSDVFSMRIDKGNRFVFRILKRDANYNVLRLEILSVKGHYENLDRRVMATRESIQFPWPEVSDFQ